MKTTSFFLCLLALSMLLSQPMLAAPTPPGTHAEEAQANAPDVSAHARRLHGERAGKKIDEPKKASTSVIRRGKSPAPVSELEKVEIPTPTVRIAKSGEAKPISAPTALPPSEPAHERVASAASIGGPVRTGAGNAATISGATVKSAGNTAAISGTTVKRKP